MIDTGEMSVTDAISMATIPHHPLLHAHVLTTGAHHKGGVPLIQAQPPVVSNVFLQMLMGADPRE